MSTEPARRLFTIQYLRAVSAMAIVLFHAGIHYHVFIPIGDGRIALFFIVSGFIFWWITTGRNTRPDDFLLRRMARLAPLYWLVTLILYVAAALGLSSHPPATLTQLAQSLLFAPHLNSAGQLFPILVPGWTLVYEMFFCMVFAGLLYVDEGRRIWVLTVLFGCLTAVGFVFRPANPIAFTYTNQILLEFLAGAWLARLWPLMRLSALTALGLLAAGVVLSLIPIPFWASGLPVLTSGAPALLMVIGAIGLEQPGLPPIRWLKRIGDSSYSIYLWHIPVLVAGAALLRVFHVDSPAVVISCTTAAGIVFGLVLYEWLERPLTAFLFDLLERFPIGLTRRVIPESTTP